MSAVPETTPATQPAVEATEPTTTTTTNTAATPTEPETFTSAPETPAQAEEAAKEAKPETEAPKEESKEEAKEDAAAPAEEKKTEEKTEEKPVEPITEGQLAYKGPGLLKSLVPSKKEFWLSDEKVTPQKMDSYMRGEKPEVSNPVVAWASESGKGLLFFNKKGETDRSRPQSVLPLYDASELKKASPHEITFDISGHKHTLKASSDAERDGWFMSIERAMEMGKAEKETIRGSEGYKAELEKLSKYNVSMERNEILTMPADKPNAGAGAVAGASTARSKSQPKKSTDGEKADKAEEPQRTGSEADEEAEKKQKSRSTSRGMFNKLKGKKDEVATKAEEKKEEKKEEHEEKKAEKEEAKADKEAEKASEPAAAAPAVDAPSTAEGAAAAPVEDKQEPAAESGAAAKEDAPAAKPEEKAAKQNKRSSIFGRMSSGFSGFKSPSKEKSEKEAELKPEVPAKDNAVSESAPQIPEPATETTETPAANAEAEKADSKPAEAAEKKPEETTQQKGFLSGLPFMNKRNRSVSPSANATETPAKEESAPVEPTTVAAPDETIKPAAAETPATDSNAEKADEKPAEKVEEPKAPAESTPNKRSSMFGNIGRRASKAFKGMQSPTKKENAAPAAAETKKEESTAEGAATKSDEDKPAVNGESKATEPSTEQKPAETIGDVVPGAVNVGETEHQQPQQQAPPAVAASA
ncbi:hypothetical protein KC332_g17207 [Hortaea werneckii]|uniref:Meiotic expression up-regulated protein 6 PH domain-containing protein n=1 Tax=Hortaea werneckii EXF-2000 TaxID=1157616 RepID=A0A1Z5TMK9_HORWE|nr:hypothetical protein KC358_g10626 [Hortaea werneckii]OTA37273.1 hypothetical protein BTJ68_02695 [Hortaea werneckii EXF-2000]KAI6905026.1 hypothetical protein KC348_g15102 [Hortaea werneckii]KAI6923367.1 hypothetical protein KC341_g14785 [Hortaea werneckii]KAI6966198.1 hypothetical protein KC321_g9684 [Hortaea werneckii]